MVIKDLIKFLEQFPEDLPVLFTHREGEGYDVIDETRDLEFDDIFIQKGVHGFIEFGG